MTTIPRGIIDEHYRYKRPLCIVSPIKNQKTQWENPDEIVSSLWTNDVVRENPKRFKLLLTTFIKSNFRCEFKVSQSIVTIGRTVSQKELENVLEEFVERYLICQGCLKPETTMSVSGSTICLDCRGCGRITRRKVVDPIDEKMAKIM